MQIIHGATVLFLAPAARKATAKQPRWNAYFGMIKTLDYYSNVQQRNGIDGANRRIAVGVHFQSGLRNSFWHIPGSNETHPGNPPDYGRCGDGDLSKNGAYTSLDLVAHEITRGVTAYAAVLI